MGVVLFSLPLWGGAQSPTSLSISGAAVNGVRAFDGRGVVLAVKPDSGQVVIRHEAITNYMAAMTMPFKVKDTNALSGLGRGDQVSFQLHVTDTESWVDHLAKTGTSIQLPPESAPAQTSTNASEKWLLDYKFTNELGQAVSIHDFRGQALAITFFYTRCPLPDFCPRLSKNFQEAMQKLEAMTNAPANWHFLSISFDPRSDTPEVLRNYGEGYHYEPKHWSFLTGPPDKVAELAHASGVEYEVDGSTINHNFRTYILAPDGHVQMIFPTSGDLSEQIVAQILQALTSKNGK